MQACTRLLRPTCQRGSRLLALRYESRTEDWEDRESATYSACTLIGRRISIDDCWITVAAPCSASVAMIAATKMSGHPVPVPNTPAAAISTARLPSTSLRVQIHAERMFASPPRCVHSSANDAALATRAATPTAPIVKA